MKRRTFAGAMMVAVAVAATAMFGSAAIAQQKVSWTLITAFPASSTEAQRMMEFAKAAEVATDGKFHLRVLVAGQHPYQYRDGLRIVTDKLAEISHTGLTYLTSVEGWFGLPMVPFAVPYEKQHEFFVRWHEEIVNPYLAQKYKLKVLAYFLDSGGAGNAIHTPVPLKDFNSLKGLKIRAHDKNTSALAQVLGATPATVPFSELYVAVQRKTIDGVMTSLQGAYAQKLWELLKYTNMYEPYFGVDEFVVDQEKWDSLPADIKPKLAALFQQWFSMKPMLAFHTASNEKIMAEAKEKYGANFSNMEPSFRDEARKRTAYLLKAYVDDGGDLAKRSVALLEAIVAKK